jgi:hypothetical protein
MSTTDIIKQLTIFQKQNEGIISSLKSKNIELSYEVIDESLPDEEKLEKYKALNVYLKDLSLKHRPPPPVKEEQKVKQEQKPKEQKPKDDDDEEELIKETKPTFSTVTNMEEIKRAFFSKEYKQAYELITAHPFKFYEAIYKYADDNIGKPDYAAKNLLRGFTQGLDDYRKYLMVCFRCILTDKDTRTYNYPSYWIVNSNDDLKEILGSLYDDYDFVSTSNIQDLLKQMEKNENEDDNSIIGEVYLH